jgi:hypothetical protein
LFSKKSAPMNSTSDRGRSVSLRPKADIRHHRPFPRVNTKSEIESEVVYPATSLWQEGGIVHAPSFNKRAPRIDLRRPAVLVDSDGRESDVIILDVSSGGFRLEVTESPRIGEFVTIRVERGEDFKAQIRWALGSEAGAIFLGPVDQSKWT